MSEDRSHECLETVGGQVAGVVSVSSLRAMAWSVDIYRVSTEYLQYLQYLQASAVQVLASADF